MTLIRGLLFASLISLVLFSLYFFSGGNNQTADFSGLLEITTVHAQHSAPVDDPAPNDPSPNSEVQDHIQTTPNGTPISEPGSFLSEIAAGNGLAEVPVSEVPGGQVGGSVLTSEGWAPIGPDPAPADPGPTDPGTIGSDPSSPNEGNTDPGGGDNPPAPNPTDAPVVCTSNCSPIPAFVQYRPISYCQAVGQPKVTLSWSPTTNFTTYRVYYIDSSDLTWTPQPAGGILTLGTNTDPVTFTLDSSLGLIPGHQYGFIIRAGNLTGYYTDSDNGVWSFEKFAEFTPFPTCNPPSAFNFSAAPKGVCPSVNNPQINLRWGTSTYATNYRVMYRDVADYVERVYSDRGLNQDETVRSLIPGHRYGFLIAATNNLGTVYSNNAWSDQVFGPVIYPDCTSPIVNVFLTSPGYNNGQPKSYTDTPPMSVKQTNPVTISWNTINANTNCTASIPAQLSNGKPTPANILAAWGGNKSNTGSQALPQLITIGTYPFTLTCYNPWNASLTTSSTIQLIVEQIQKPFIQTTGGDVHTNESIYIPQN